MKYLCPIETCNVFFDGEKWDIIPQAIGHAQGSHQTIYDSDDVIKIISKFFYYKPIIF